MNDIPTISELAAVMAKFRPHWFAKGAIGNLRPHQAIFREPPKIRELVKSGQACEHRQLQTITLFPRLLYRDDQECVVWEYNGPVTTNLPT